MAITPQRPGEPGGHRIRSRRTDDCRASAIEAWSDAPGATCLRQPRSFQHEAGAKPQEGKQQKIVDEEEEDQRRGYRPRDHWRRCRRGPHQTVDDEWLPPGLGHRPASEDRYEPERRGSHRGKLERARVVKPAAPA